MERNNAAVRLTINLFLKDASFCSASLIVSVIRKEVFSLAVYFRNVLYGSKKLSIFEIALGYTPSLKRLPQNETFCRPCSSIRRAGSKNSLESTVAHSICEGILGTPNRAIVV